MATLLRFVLGLLACSAVQAASLTYEPVGLAWSADEVERATAGQFTALAQRAAQTQALGCDGHCSRLARIFGRLVGEARQQSPRAQALPWALTVVQLADVEALALPGGQVVIGEPFIDQRSLGDEALAFVLAHEMAHSILEHERQTLTFARMLLPRQVQRSVRDMYTELAFNFALLKATEPAMQQGEYEADELGLLLAAAAGFEPERQLTFLEREATLGTDSPALLSTHPAAAARLQALRERLPLAQRVWRLAAE